MADFPDIEPDLEEIGLIANNQVYDSILTGQVQTASLSGAKWTCAPTFSNRNGKEARDLRAFIFGQNGVSGRFNYYPASIDNAGTHAGLGVVDGAGQTGSTLVTKDWDADQSLLFAAGDYLTVNGEMKMVTADVPVGQDYIEYDETNYMPSPFDPSGWFGASSDPDGTITNVTLDNPSGEIVLGIAQQVAPSIFLMADSNTITGSDGDEVYAGVLIKQIDMPRIRFRFYDSQGFLANVFYSVDDNIFTDGTGIATELEDGFFLVQAKLLLSRDDPAVGAQIYAWPETGSTDNYPPIGSQCYVQAAFFGKANDWPAKLRANATIPITPPLRTSPADGALIEANNPYFQGRLESDDMSRLQVSSPVIYNTTLSIVEAF